MHESAVCTSKTNVAEVFSHVMATEGWTGLFRGNGVNVLRVAPNKGIELFAYERTKNFLTPKEGQRPRFPLPVAPLAGSVAGITSTIVTYPLELIKTRLTVQPGEYKGLLDAWARIVKEEGFLELYRGLFPSMIGVIPYAGVNYYAYDSLRNLYKRVLKTDKVDSFSTLCMGSAAGAIASTATFPLEVARKQMQVGALQGRVVYKNTLDALACISREQGLQGLYRGLGPSCLKLMPAAGIFFMCYEALKAVALEEETQKAAAVAATAGAGKQAPGIGNKKQAEARVLQPALVAAKRTFTATSSIMALPDESCTAKPKALARLGGLICPACAYLLAGGGGGGGRTKTQNFCRNVFNVTGLCNRSSCPLANSRYATIREFEGVLYLYMKSIERAHMPKHLWERVKLPRNYAKALETIDRFLEHWPRFLVHKNKQRLTKMTQYLIRMRKLALAVRPKLVTVPAKQEKREARREKKAEVAAKLNTAIEKELLQRLQSGTYGDIYNFPTKEYDKVLAMEEMEAEADEEAMEAEEELEEEEPEVEFVEDYDVDEADDDFEDFNAGEGDIEGNDDDEAEEGDDELPLHWATPSPSAKRKPGEAGLARSKRRRQRVEVEYEEEREPEVAR
eukprot:SM000081S22650  [mRNA]  locus=s81:294672:301933:+ [translate_table: standard]